MLMIQKRLTYFILTSFSFILGCTLTLFFLHTTTLKPIASPIDVSKIKLLVLILSAVKNQIRRDAIRETWAQAYGDVKILFVLSKDQYLNAEKLIHSDILEVNIPDEYRLLSHKLLESFNSVRNIDFDYLLKCDDDTFVDVTKVINELETAPKNKFYWGYFDGNAHIKRAGKWKETEWILCDKYLPYALGGGYVLSKDLIIYMVNNKDYLSFFISEDVSVGVWLAPLNITRKHDRRFDTEFRSRGCCNDYLVTHKRSPQVMKLYWSHIIETGKMCNEEYKDISSYEYNWTVMPSKCCVKNALLCP
ncbi:Glycosyl transferase, family 31 [Cinara cedri]|uniref:Hexosyltransferase n=1 Tax=Cinara cedri TaxID=506608 RepID=A0A5E4NHN0_9HEMI|nr:Glycosyl transferase, family 31 [Cinara cedri]